MTQIAKTAKTAKSVQTTEQSPVGIGASGPGRIAVRRALERGRTSIGWLESFHTFSFGEYVDPAHMQFRTLRVINDDVVAPAAGFGMHGHRDMEIVTVVLSGAIAHKDSLGHGAVVRPGDVQVMSAGTGIRHSEHNPSRDEPVHLLQIWILPDAQGRAPRYDQRAFPLAERRGRLQVVAAGGTLARPDALSIGQDAAIAVGSFAAGDAARHPLGPGRGAWIHVATGNAVVQGVRLGAGDAVSVEDAADVVIEGVDAAPADVLVFDVR
jgi:redox-sensitive bicupin YhaK (pirin superfamily)